MHERSGVSGALRPADAGRTVRVLAVDDSPTVRSVVILAFTGMPGYAVRVEADSMAWLEEARRAAAAQGAYDCFVLDIEMDPFDGFELSRRLRAEPTYMSTPILFLTSSTDPAVHDEALALGGGFLSKSSITELRTSLRQAVDELARPAVRRTGSHHWRSGA